jgi:hypothetical protein
MTNPIKKITLATIKSFVKKNPELYMRRSSKFDGMIDCVVSTQSTTFRRTLRSEINLQRTLGIAGAWFVGGSRDYFDQFDDGEFVGYRIHNCCGAFYLAIKK